mmetsp:Transcript_46220/g.114612  ORF Transcript_46220/g.114612 Transcript_46220/m.114612 type:complete len:563 (-) Transcript_46220:333-2021(-)
MVRQPRQRAVALAEAKRREETRGAHCVGVGVRPHAQHREARRQAGAAAVPVAHAVHVGVERPSEPRPLAWLEAERVRALGAAAAHRGGAACVAADRRRVGGAHLPPQALRLGAQGEVLEGRLAGMQATQTHAAAHRTARVAGRHAARSERTRVRIDAAAHPSTHAAARTRRRPAAVPPEAGGLVLRAAPESSHVPRPQQLGRSGALVRLAHREALAHGGRAHHVAAGRLMRGGRRLLPPPLRAAVGLRVGRVEGGAVGRAARPTEAVVHAAAHRQHALRHHAVGEGVVRGGRVVRRVERVVVGGVRRVRRRRLLAEHHLRVHHVLRVPAAHRRGGVGGAPVDVVHVGVEVRRRVVRRRVARHLLARRGARRVVAAVERVVRVAGVRVGLRRRHAVCHGVRPARRWRRELLPLPRRDLTVGRLAGGVVLGEVVRVVPPRPRVGVRLRRERVVCDERPCAHLIGRPPMEHGEELARLEPYHLVGGGFRLGRLEDILEKRHHLLPCDLPSRRSGVTLRVRHQQDQVLRAALLHHRLPHPLPELRPWLPPLHAEGPYHSSSEGLLP